MYYIVAYRPMRSRYKNRAYWDGGEFALRPNFIVAYTQRTCVLHEL